MRAAAAQRERASSYSSMPAQRMLEHATQAGFRMVSSGAFASMQKPRIAVTSKESKAPRQLRDSPPGSRDQHDLEGGACGDIYVTQHPVPYRKHHEPVSKHPRLEHTMGWRGAQTQQRQTFSWIWFAIAMRERASRQIRVRASAIYAQCCGSAATRTATSE
jgi:hypothetical protein